MNIIMFTQPNMLQKVLLQEKTQTRRRWNPNYLPVQSQPNGNIEAIVPYHIGDYLGKDTSVEMWTEKNMFIVHAPQGSVNGRAHYAVGGVNTVTGGRGKNAVWYVGSHTMALSDHYGWDIKKNRPAITQDFIKHGYKPLKLRVKQLRIEDVRGISLEDVKAEGFPDYLSFMRVWCGLHDKSFHIYNDSVVGIFAEPLFEGERKSRKMNSRRVMHLTDEMFVGEIKKRPADRYKAVVIDFEVFHG
jgi:hypothetical protein